MFPWSVNCNRKTAIALSDIRIFSSNMHYPGACITFCKEELLSDIQWLDDRYGFSKEIVEYPGMDYVEIFLDISS